MITLYDYYRSTACYRVRIALNWKKIHYEIIPIHLLKDGGEQHLPAYLQKNPQGLVPTLDENGHILTQSLAIIEYLEEMHPQPALLPNTPLARAQIRQLALIVACDMHPLNNLSATTRLRSQFEANDEAIQDWYYHWLKRGFDAIETHLQALPRTQPLCYGDEVTLADVCLIPQVYNAKRFNFSMDAYPLISQIDEYCLKIPAFLDAEPVAQPT